MFFASNNDNISNQGVVRDNSEVEKMERSSEESSANTDEGNKDANQVEMNNLDNLPDEKNQLLEVKLIYHGQVLN